MKIVRYTFYGHASNISQLKQNKKLTQVAVASTSFTGCEKETQE